MELLSSLEAIRSVTAIWELMLSINLPTTGRRADSEEESGVAVGVGVGMPERGGADGVDEVEDTAGAEVVEEAGGAVVDGAGGAEIGAAGAKDDGAVGAEVGAVGAEEKGASEAGGSTAGGLAEENTEGAWVGGAKV